jgi:hypothetical protein
MFTGKKGRGWALGATLFVMTAVLLPSLAPAALAGEIAPPSASNFGAMLVLTTTDNAKAHGKSLKMERVDCVEPTRGRYMCSYNLRVPGSPGGCHLIQARWTPSRASIFTVTLAGRTSRCQSLSDALHSLR